jgi:hypothetical protein
MEENRLKIDGDELCNEHTVFRSVAKEQEDLSTDQKMVQFFRKFSIPNLLKIVKFVLSIPVSNAAVENVYF